MPKVRRKRRRKRRVEEPLTEELLDELLSASDPQTFFESHEVRERSLSDYLRELLDLHGIERADAIHRSGLNETYGYQLFAGQRANPSRDKVLQLVFGMGLTLKEASRLMKIAGVSPLYCKNRRDAIIIFCISKRLSLQAVNEELFRFGEQTVC